MELEPRFPLPLALPSASSGEVNCCNCGCTCSWGDGSSGKWFRSVKRKYEEFAASNTFLIPGLDLGLNPKVLIENECEALRETVSSQQLAIQDLYAELEQERNASSSAANEAMSMILRLQREKAEIQMESRQFKRFVEEKMAHDQQEFVALEDLVYKREQVIQSLNCEMQAYKHRMLSYGLTMDEIDGEKVENLDGTNLEFPEYDYPRLKCSVNENPNALDGEDDEIDIEKYAFGETPRGKENLKSLESRIFQMENSPRSIQMDGDLYSSGSVKEKVVVGHSPRRIRDNRKLSHDSSNLPFGTSKEDFSHSPSFKVSSGLRKGDYFCQYDDMTGRMDTTPEFADEMNDRVYTIDSVYTGTTRSGEHEPKPKVGNLDDYCSTPINSLCRDDLTDPDIKKLYTRLQALEADRESMRQAIVSMRTDKAQLVLLKEIAQHLCKDMTTPVKQKPVTKRSVIRSFSLLAAVKWIVSFVFWRKRAHQNRCIADLTKNSTAGLLMLLDNSPRARQWRCLSSTQV